MQSLTRIRMVWLLREAGHGAEEIAWRVGVSRATVYRWLRGIKRYGVRRFRWRYKRAKRGHRQRKASRYVEERVLAIRQAHHGSCGEKIVYWLAQEGIVLSRSTVYRVLAKHAQLRVRGRRNQARGAVPQGLKPRQVIQMDTVDFGDVFAFTAIDTFTREASVVMRPRLTSQDGAAALAHFAAYFGRCDMIQTDGGTEFQAHFQALAASIAGGHRVARPYKKNEQAFIERFNRTLRHECLGWKKYPRHFIPILQHHVDSWLQYYHFVRPHMAFQPMRPPLVPESHLI
jgi:transposase